MSNQQLAEREVVAPPARPARDPRPEWPPVDHSEDHLIRGYD